MRIELATFSQGKFYTCLPASIRIVLQYYGYELSEDSIAEACQVNRRGARFDDAVQFVQTLGFEAIRFKAGSIVDLFDYLTENKPIIVALGAEHLPYANDRTTHAVVVNGLESDKVIYIEPAFGRELQLESLTFFKAWNSRGCSGLVIKR